MSVVIKFGGTSVGSADGIRRAVEIVKAALSRRPVVVVSALSGVTDMLLAAARSAASGNGSSESFVDPVRKRHSEVLAGLGLATDWIDGEISELRSLLTGISLLGDASGASLDAAAAFGERMSSKIVAAFASASGLNATAFNSYELGMLTDGNFGNADVLPSSYGMIGEAFSGLTDGVVPVVTGFLGRTESGKLTTLGRGGSDYSAAIFGASLGAEEIQIWTDVDGIMTADPKIVPEAKLVELISFKEASELAFFGAKVLHPKSILPAMKKEIPVRVLNTFNPSGTGTTILKDIVNGRNAPVTALTYKKNILVINIYSTRMLFAHGFLGRVFGLFDEFKVPVDMIATSEVNVTVTVDSGCEVSGLVNRLKEFSTVTVLDDRASVSVVGEGIASQPGILGRIFSRLGGKNINIEMTTQSYSEVNLGVVVLSDRVEDAVRVLHRGFFGGVKKHEFRKKR